MTADEGTRRLSHWGTIGLFVAVVVGVLAPVFGGLDRPSASRESVRLEPGASVLLVAHHEVTLDSGDGATAIRGCAIAGPRGWYHSVAAMGSTAAFRTGPEGDYKITCQGGAVQVENDSGGQPATVGTDHSGHHLTAAALVAAGVIALASLGVLLVARGRRKAAAGPDLG